MEILKKRSVELEDASEELIAKYNRSAENVGSSLYKRGYTIISNVKPKTSVYSIPQSDGTVKTGETAVFYTYIYDKEGNFIKEGTVSLRSLFRLLYPNTDSQVGSFYQVNGVNKYGNSPVEVAERLMRDGLCFKAGDVVPACLPKYIAATNEMSFRDMDKKDMTTFDIVPVPENIMADLTKA